MICTVFLLEGGQESDDVFGKKLKRAFSWKLHKIEIKRERLQNGNANLDGEDDDNESNNGNKNERKLKRRPPSASVPKNTKDTKITSEISIIEEVRKLNEAYQFILCEHHRKLELKKRRESSYAKSSAKKLTSNIKYYSAFKRT